MYTLEYRDRILPGDHAMEDQGFVEISAILHCAVYGLMKRNEVVYIGQTKKPFTRLYSHSSNRGKLEPWKARYKTRKTGFQFDRIWIRPCMLNELDQLEAEMIKLYQPKHNVKHMPEKPCLELQMLIEMMPAVCMQPLADAPQPRQTAPWRRL